MANNCAFYLEVIGKPENIDRFEKMIVNDDSLNLFDDEFYIRGVEICTKDDVKELEDGYAAAAFSGMCRNSIEESQMLESGHIPYMGRSFISLSDASKLLGLSIEGFSEETGNGFQEHYLTVNGKYNTLYSADLEEISVDTAEKLLRKFFKDNSDYGYTYDDIAALVDDNGNIRLGGFDDFGVYQTEKNFEDLKKSLEKIHVFRYDRKNNRLFHNAIKYWSNSIGELHYHGKFDITEDQLPFALKTIYQDPDFTLFEHYGSRVHLAETEKGYGIALINEYDEDFAEECDLSMDFLFETALKDMDNIKNYPLFKNADIYLGEYTGVDDCHELAVVFPTDISYEEFNKAATILDTLVYKHAYEIREINETVESIINDVVNQFAVEKNKTAYGEPQAWSYLDNERYFEITLEQEGLSENEYFCSVRLHANDIEFVCDAFKETNGVIAEFTTNNSSPDELRRVLKEAVQINNQLPVKEYKPTLDEKISMAKSTRTESAVSLQENIKTQEAER